jgi:hypothetical protein
MSQHSVMTKEQLVILPQERWKRRIRSLDCRSADIKPTIDVLQSAMECCQLSSLPLCLDYGPDGVDITSACVCNTAANSSHSTDVAGRYHSEH